MLAKPERARKAIWPWWIWIIVVLFPIVFSPWWLTMVCLDAFIVLLTILKPNRE